ncbi:hypothetical protein K438DRAFT_1753537 [Mycena galopus ATCC 62051]|nr:hypothetical protein K438DRAFT_1753537 [Mycena galopus ATCC 62051]
MARLSALFCAVVVAASSAAAAAVQERDSALITFFTDSMSILHSFSSGTQITVSQLSWPRVYVLRHGIYRLHPTQPAVCLVGLQRPDRHGHPVHLVEAAGKSITLTGNVPNLVNLEFNDLVCARLRL